MSDLPKEMDYATLLPQSARSGYPLYRHDMRAVAVDTLRAEQASTDGLTRKYLLGLDDGREIETVVIASLQRAFHEGRDLIQEDLVKEVEACVPLSVMMKEDMEALREWAHLRARPAS